MFATMFAYLTPMKTTALKPKKQSHPRVVDGPAWRWKQAVQLCRNETSAATDPLVFAVVDYCRHNYASSKSVVLDGAEYEIHAALKIQRSEHVSRVARLLVLGGADHDVIAGQIGVDSQLLAVWRRLFFDIARCHRSPRWMHKHIFDPEILNGQLEFAEALIRAWQIRLDCDEKRLVRIQAPK
jgi:hypothetical protein